MPELRQIYVFAGFEVDTIRFEVRRDGLPLSITRKEFELLALLADRAPAAVTKDDILNTVWAATSIEEGTLTKTISRLRSSLGPTGAPLIGTVTGVGYRLDATVERRLPPTPLTTQPLVQPSSTTTPSPSGSRAWLGPAVVMAGLLVAGLAWWWTGRAPTPLEGPALSLTGWFGDVAIAPAGQWTAVVRRLSPVGPGIVEVYADQASDPVWRDAEATANTDARGLTWSPDGRRFGYALGSPQAQSWVTVDLTTSPPTRKTHPLPSALAQAASFTWFSDTVLIAGGIPDSGLLEWSIPTGATRLLTHPPTTSLDTMPTLSPDARRTAFVRVGSTGEGEVYVMADGGAEQSLTDDDGVVSGVSWTPDGEAIVFSSTRAGRASGGLWRVATSGGPVTAVAEDVARAIAPVQRDETLAYVERYRDANLYLRRGLEAWQPLFESADDEHSPTLSPDGTRVAFISSRSGAEEVWVGALDAAAPRPITAIGGAGVGTPRWSPDGRWIAFDATPAGDGNIYVIPADGGSPRQLTRTSTHDVIPAWSPDGRWLYFRSHRDDAARLHRLPVSEAGPVADAAPTIVADEPIWEAQAGTAALVFIRQLEGRGLFRRPPTGGTSRLIPGTDSVVTWRAWTVAGDDAYYVEEAAPGTVRLMAATLNVQGAPRPLWEGPWSRLRGYPSLAVSADASRIVLARADERLRVYRRKRQ